MKVAIFSTKPYEQKSLEAVNLKYGHDLHFFDLHLNECTVALASGFKSVCVFVNDQVNKGTLYLLAAGGTRLIALRCAGYNNIDLEAATELGLTVVRVPEYSPYAVFVLLSINYPSFLLDSVLMWRHDLAILNESETLINKIMLIQ